MPTKSIMKNINLKKEEDICKFVNALERAEKKSKLVTLETSVKLKSPPPSRSRQSLDNYIKPDKDNRNQYQNFAGKFHKVHKG